MTQRVKDINQVNKLTGTIISAAIEVHKDQGPGLLESAYESCLVFDLGERGVTVEQQKTIPVVYKDVKLDCGYRLDILVEDQVIVETKTLDELAPIH